MQKIDWEIKQYFPNFIKVRDILIPYLRNISYKEQFLEIFKNQQNLITSFDIYYTIRHIIDGEVYKNIPLNANKNEGENLFK